MNEQGGEVSTGMGRMYSDIYLRTNIDGTYINVESQERPRPLDQGSNSPFTAHTWKR